MKKGTAIAVMMSLLVFSGCSSPTDKTTTQATTTVSETSTASEATTVTAADNTSVTTKPITVTTSETATVTSTPTETTTVKTTVSETTTKKTTSTEETAADTIQTIAASTTTTATAIEDTTTTTEDTTSAAETEKSLDEKLTERERIQITRDNILFDFTSAYGNDSDEKKTTRYINDNTEYTLEIPKALAEFLQPGDKIIFRAYVNREKINGEYARYLVLDSSYADNCCAVDRNENGIIDESELDDAIFSRMYLLNGFLVIRNDRLMLDDALAALGLAIDDMSYDKEAYDTFKKVYTDYERKSIYYGLYGGYNKYDETSGAYEYRDGMPLAELVELMKRVRTEKLLEIKEADDLGADVEWYFWVIYATADNGAWIEATVK